MGRKSKVKGLPRALREELDRRLLENGFSGYRAFETWIKTRGYEISKSALQRYGSTFEQRCAAMKLATEQARAVCAASPDDEAALSDALIKLVQTRLFEVLVETEMDEPDLARLAKATADLGRATLSQRRWAEQVRERLEAQKAAAGKKIGEIEKNGGLSPESAAAIRAALLEINPLRDGEREKRLPGGAPAA